MRLLLPSLVLALAGCAAGAPPRLVPEPEQVGTYAYEISFEVTYALARGSTRSERFDLQGIVAVEADTLLIDARHGLCHPAFRPNVSRFIFTCDEYTLSFDRRRPSMNPQYAAQVPVTQAVRGECAEWRTNSNGTRTCVRYEYHDVPGTRYVQGSIRIRPVRASPAGAP